MRVLLVVGVKRDGKLELIEPNASFQRKKEVLKNFKRDKTSEKYERVELFVGPTTRVKLSKPIKEDKNEKTI